MGAFKTDLDTSDLIFEGSFQTNTEKQFLPFLRDKSSTEFKEKSLLYQTMLQNMFQGSDLQYALRKCVIEKFDNTSNGNGAVVLFQLFLDRGSIQRTASSLEETVKSIIINNTKMGGLEQISIDPATVFIKRFFDGGTGNIPKAQTGDVFRPNSDNRTLEVKNGILRKAVQKPQPTTEHYENVTMPHVTITKEGEFMEALEYEGVIPVIVGIFTEKKDDIVALPGVPETSDDQTKVTHYQTAHYEVNKTENSSFAHDITSIEAFNADDVFKNMTDETTVSLQGAENKIPPFQKGEPLDKLNIKDGGEEEESVPALSNNNAEFSHIIYNKSGTAVHNYEGGTLFESNENINPFLIKTNTYNDRYFDSSIRKISQNEKDVYFQESDLGTYNLSHEPHGKNRILSTSIEPFPQTISPESPVIINEQPWHPILPKSEVSTHRNVHSIPQEVLASVSSTPTNVMKYASSDDDWKPVNMDHSENTASVTDSYIRSETNKNNVEHMLRNSEIKDGTNNGVISHSSSSDFPDIVIIDHIKNTSEFGISTKNTSDNFSLPKISLLTDSLITDSYSDHKIIETHRVDPVPVQKVYKNTDTVPRIPLSDKFQSVPVFMAEQSESNKHSLPKLPNTESSIITDLLTTIESATVEALEESSTPWPSVRNSVTNKTEQMDETSAFVRQKSQSISTGTERENVVETVTASITKNVNMSSTLPFQPTNQTFTSPNVRQSTGKQEKNNTLWDSVLLKYKSETVPELIELFPDTLLRQKQATAALSQTVRPSHSHSMESLSTLDITIGSVSHNINGGHNTMNTTNSTASPMNSLQEKSQMKSPLFTEARNYVAGHVQEYFKDSKITTEDIKNITASLLKNITTTENSHLSENGSGVTQELKMSQVLKELKNLHSSHDQASEKSNVEEVVTGRWKARPTIQTHTKFSSQGHDYTRKQPENIAASNESVTKSNHEMQSQLSETPALERSDGITPIILPETELASRSKLSKTFINRRQPKMHNYGFQVQEQDDNVKIIRQDTPQNLTNNLFSASSTTRTRNRNNETEIFSDISSRTTLTASPTSLYSTSSTLFQKDYKVSSGVKSAPDLSATGTYETDLRPDSTVRNTVVNINYTISKVSTKFSNSNGNNEYVEIRNNSATKFPNNYITYQTSVEHNGDSEKEPYNYYDRIINTTNEEQRIVNEISKFATVHMTGSDKKGHVNKSTTATKVTTTIQPITQEPQSAQIIASSSDRGNQPLFSMLTKTFNKVSTDGSYQRNSMAASTIVNVKTEVNTSETACPRNYSFQCGDGECISQMSRCNQLVDCSDGADEKQCTCADYLKTQFSTRKLCDGVVDCWDFTDEINCEWCRLGQFVCPNSQVCVDQEKLCDGATDCPFGDDEKRCVTVSKSTREADNFTYQSEGFLMVRKRGQWGKLCLHNFEKILAKSQSSWKITDLGRAVCKAMTYSDFDTVEHQTEIIKNVDEVDDDHYFEITFAPPNSTEYTQKSVLSFQPSECPQQELLHVTCKDLECGIRPQAVNQWARSRHSRIVGGGNAGPGSWPWQAALYKEGEFQCGATLISEYWLISAGHCFYHALDDFWVARLGALRRGTSFPSPYEQQMPITDIILHPNYIDNGFINDITLLRMQGPVAFSDYVRPICLPKPDSVLKDGRLCTVIGWGQLFEDGRIFPDTLQEVQLPIITTAECRKRTVLLPLYRVTENMFCAGFDRGGRDACLGDSGGPLMCQEPDGRWTLYGVTSNGYGCARANRPGVYTKVSNYMPWITQSMNQNGRSLKKPEPFCRGHRCPLGECLPKSRVCNGFMECSDGSDEKGCW
ncbi:uncharacterized protein LOC126412088 [Schistocerca serialis cubense]|uniref:uncharacterized protein LOC126412088 n=1 Tax=Schistocerca serialis cubense TaxID=2023355 RepID=UPI00214F0F35|nr:uncharacterized protein LOC126412088 [Schistocerca serialis cubense]